MPRLVEQYFDKERQLLDILYDQWPVGEEVMNINQATITPDINFSAIGKAMRQFESLGILQKRMTFGDTSSPSTIGRHFHYTLLMTKEGAVNALETSIRARQDATRDNYTQGRRSSADKRRGVPQTRKVNPDLYQAADAIDVALATDDREDVRAIAGDDAPSSLGERLRTATKAARLPDESAALVEAARQYAGRTNQLQAKVKELEAVAAELGMTIDTSQLMGAVSFEPDPVLETVALTLPYITTLERRVEALGTTIAEQREKLKGFDELRIQNRRLHEQNQRLLARTVDRSAMGPAHA